MSKLILPAVAGRLCTSQVRRQVIASVIACHYGRQDVVHNALDRRCMFVSARALPLGSIEMSALKTIRVAGQDPFSVLHCLLIASHRAHIAWCDDSPCVVSRGRLETECKTVRQEQICRRGL